MRGRPRRRTAGRREGSPRLLVPFTAKQLDPTVLDAALRIARAEDAVLVPAYLLVVPLEFSLEAPVQHAELQRAMPILEAVELAARRAGVPVDARIERGRTPIDALQRLWAAEQFDRTVVPAPRPGHRGFAPNDLAWMLTHAPNEMLILRPGPVDDEDRETAVSTPSRGLGARLR
jgi:nucleotide-binding universal stress UspA family protein